MSRPGLVSFRRTDKIPEHIEETVKEVADFFKVRRECISQFCSMIKISKRWNSENLENKLSIWEGIFPKSNENKKIVDIIKKGFKNCRNNEEITSLRGALVEALVIGCNGGSRILSDRSYGWGAKVDIQKSTEVLKIRYNCSEYKCESCEDRKTVDFGFWNGYHGKFYECKVLPKSIGCKEISYMKNLKSVMISEKISHEIFFVCADRREEVKIKLESNDLSPVYKPYGIEDIRSLMTS
jgi:hypothetical protein